MLNLLRRLFGRTYKECPTPADGGYILVIVDMQPQFDASLDPDTLAAVSNEIVRAMYLRNPIVLLEYANYGSTNSKLKELIGSYSHCTTRVKHADDGSAEVLDACQDHKSPLQRFRVCGVNTHACVADTVSGLSGKVPDATIEVVKAACNDYDCDNNWHGFPRRANVVLTNVT